MAYDRKTYMKKYKKKWMRENEEHIILSNKKYWLKIKHNLSYEDWLEMWEAQNGKCAICGNDFPSQYRAAVVDHDHKTGKIRGLLCNKCNRGIGYLNDDEKILTSAIEYLRGGINYE